MRYITAVARKKFISLLRSTINSIADQIAKSTTLFPGTNTFLLQILGAGTKEYHTFRWKVPIFLLPAKLNLLPLLAPPLPRSSCLKTSSSEGSGRRGTGTTAYYSPNFPFLFELYHGLPFTFLADPAKSLFLVAYPLKFSKALY